MKAARTIIMEQEIDFEECGKEQVHLAGTTLSHGILLVLCPIDFRIRMVSDNAERFFGRSALELLTLSIGEVLDRDSLVALRQDTPNLQDGVVLRRHLRSNSGESFNGFLHRHDGRVILELEPSGSQAVAVDNAVLSAIAASPNLYAAARSAAEEAARLTGFDRVCVYRIFEDHSGEVIAEQRVPTMPPYLGIRFPAHDFPPTAQRLQRLVGVRAVPDVNAPQSDIFADRKSIGERPLDLSYAQLRGVSPFCVQYHKNIGVGAFVTTAIEADGRFWGMISCHHGHARPVDLSIRDALTHLARSVGEAVDRLLQEHRVRSRRRTETRLAHIRTAAAESQDLIPRLLLDRPRLSTLIGAAGMALVARDRIFVRGATPPAGDVADFARWLARDAQVDDDGLFRSGSIATDYPAGASFKATASGALAVVFSHDPVAVLIGFRPELRFDAIWGGDPRHPVSRDDYGRLNPRGSFERWRQSVEGHARPWAEEDVATMRTVAACFRDRYNDAGAVPDILAGTIENCGRWFRRDEVQREEMLAASTEYMVLTARQDDGTEPVVLSANSRLCDVFNLDPSEVIGKPTSQLLAFIGLTNEIVTANEGDHVDRDVWSDTLGLRTMRIHRQTIAESRAGDESARLILLRLQDITEFRRATDALKASGEQAEASQQAIIQFLAKMSHELRSPLNAIIGFAEAIKAEIMGPVGQSAYVGFAHDIGQSGRHLLSLITDLLDLSKLEAGHHLLDEQPFDFADTVEESYRWIGKQFEGSGQSWQLERPKERILIRGDSGALRQVLINLMTNAGKYTKPGGRVTVRLIAPTEGDLILRVEDTGIGIPPEQLDHLFRPFVRANQGRAIDTGGSGLGLAISKSLVDLHGGQISLTSDGRSGTTARFTIPAWRRLASMDEVQF